MIVWISYPGCEDPIVANIAFTGTVDFDLEDETKPKVTVLEDIEVRDVAKYNEYLSEVVQIITPFVHNGMHINDLQAKLRSGFNMSNQCRNEITPDIIQKLNMVQDKDKLFFKVVPCEV
jgi:phosphopantothenoylcysteine synthetase/decarboxylase